MNILKRFVYAGLMLAVAFAVGCAADAGFAVG
jgi:hypothetical protein